MEQAQLEYFKTMLKEQLANLLQSADSTVVELLKDMEGMADPLDRAGLERDRSDLLRIRSRESRLIAKIRTAIKDIEDGFYGICDDCGEDIPVARMMARPVTRHCIYCKTRMEKKERAVGW
jgi:RNA polymerase-binding transcription factor